MHWERPYLIQSCQNMVSTWFIMRVFLIRNMGLPSLPTDWLILFLMRSFNPINPGSCLFASRLTKPYSEVTAHCNTPVLNCACLIMLVWAWLWLPRSNNPLKSRLFFSLVTFTTIYATHTQEHRKGNKFLTLLPSPFGSWLCAHPSARFGAAPQASVVSGLRALSYFFSTSMQSLLLSVVLFFTITIKGSNECVFNPLHWKNKYE